MNRILFILTIDIANLPSHFSEIVQREKEVVAQWKEQGILEHLFLRPTKNGAILIFKNMDEHGVRELVKTLPLYELKIAEEYIPMMQQF
jgi:muconolactone D-isomerase